MPLESFKRTYDQSVKETRNLREALAETIHENYHKRNINIYHMEDGDTFDMQTF
jgi:hypothetical protein